MVSVAPDFFAVGGNRQPAAADWDRGPSSLLAFGAGKNVAIWQPLAADYRGIRALLSGHTDTVNAVKFVATSVADHVVLLSGSADKTVRVWQSNISSPFVFQQVDVLKEHEGSINVLAVATGSKIFATGAADATVKIWSIEDNREASSYAINLLQTIRTKSKFFPLALSLARLDESGTKVLAIAGTRTIVQIYVSREGHFESVASLTGHEAWIRSLSFTREGPGSHDDLLLASASQDKYIRLWRIHRGEDLPSAVAAPQDPALGSLGKSLSNKAHRFDTAASKYSVTFEALLLGHEDWIFTAHWHQQNGKLRLLSASADNSLAIWEADPTSGIWVCNARLGEISAQKGATTATGSTGGYWMGLWSGSGEAVVSLGRTGGWRLWKYSDARDQWEQDVAISGHVKEVKGIAWSRDGDYLLSTSSDQTTRLFAEWRREHGTSWHEFSRPQIHGYDLNCIDVISKSRFISGADEKLLRVFDEPKAVADILDKLCGIRALSNLPDAANIPMLGLSNKAMAVGEADEGILDARERDREHGESVSAVSKSTLDFNHPPFEDHLARHMLWPETEKLYGHGYEISAVAASNDATLVATSCRASSIDHAVIRLYETQGWREVKPSLTAHTLTVTSLKFSGDDQYLLSVGRDRQWALFERSADIASKYALTFSNPKGHTRMILDCSWAPVQAGRVFATAGRDKAVKLWELSGADVVCRATITAVHPVTAVSFLDSLVHDALVLAYGEEDGSCSVVEVDGTSFETVRNTALDREFRPSGQVNQLAWRPSTRTDGQRHGVYQLSIASDDKSLRVLALIISDRS